MKLRREDLAIHLTRIACRGQVQEVVFSGAFAAAALTPDHLLLVLAPALPDVEPFPEDVGVADLNLFVRALGMVPGSEDDVAVDVRYENHRLIVDEEGRGRIRLLTAHPRTIATRVENNLVEQLFAAVGGTTVPLSAQLTTGVRNAYAGLKASAAELIVGPDGGMIRVGDESDHLAEFPSAALQAPVAYSLNFGEHLIDVLATVGGEAVLYLAGPGKMIAIQDGDYNYLLSPRSYGADRKAQERKANAKAKEAAE